jgi:hypothetical protein
MILSVVKGLLIYVNVSQEQWTGFFNRPLAKIKNLPLSEESGASSRSSGELKMSINQLNALFRDFRQFYAYFCHF